MALSNRRQVAGRLSRQMFERGDDAFQLDQMRVLRSNRRFELAQAVLQDRNHALGAQRQLVVEIAEKKRTVLEFNLELVILEHFAVLLAQNGQEQLVVQLGFDGQPVN